MHKLLLTAGICLIIASLASSSRLVCYYNSLAEDRAADGKVTVSDIDPNQCTHLIYGFSDINALHELAPNSGADFQRYVDFNGLKSQNPELKTLLAVGGPQFDTQKFIAMATDGNNREVFVESVVKQLRDEGFDGLNIDWRYPGDEKKDFTKLCQELKEAFDKEATTSNLEPLMLTASVSAERPTITDSYEVEKISKSLDFLNVMTFDLRGPMEDTVTAHHSPLFKGSQDTGDKKFLNSNSAMQYWRDQGAPKDKLNLGLGLFGRAYDLSSDSTAVGAPVSGPGEEGCFTGEAGFWAAYETCIYLEGVQTELIEDQEVPYAVIDNQWVGFENKESLTVKADYLRANNFGGAFVWSLDLDDVSGKFCKDGNYPLISHLHDLLVPDFPSSDPSKTTSATTKPTTTTTTKATTKPTTTTTTTKATTKPTTTTTTTKPTTKPTTTTTTTKATTKGSGDGGTCAEGDGRYVNPANPNTFFNCAHGIAHLQFCQRGLIYKKACDCCDFP